MMPCQVREPINAFQRKVLDDIRRQIREDKELAQVTARPKPH